MEIMPQITRTSAESKGSKHTVLAVPLVQCIVCALLVGCIFGLYRSGSPIFTAVRERYNAAMQTDYCADGVWTAAQQLAHAASKAPALVQDAVQAIASIDARAPIETVSSSGGEDIQILDALQDASFEVVHVTQEAYLPVQGNVTSGFGMRINPITGKKSFHTGLDIAATMGTPIAAAYNGTVLETGQTDGRGKYIRLQHGDTLQTMYCHLSEISVDEGDSIDRGSTIGLVGSTGMSTGPHLHFELWIDGVRCNPVYVLHGLDDA